MAKNPVPADRSSWGRFDELQERNNETLRTILDAAAAGSDPGSKKIGDYYASCMDETAINAKGAAPLEPAADEDRGAHERQRARAARRRAAHDRRQPLLQLRRRSRLQGRVGRDGDRGPGRPGPAGPRLLLQGRREIGGAAEAVRRAHREDVGVARRPGRTGAAAAAQHGDEDRDRAGEGGARRVSRRDPNKIYHKLSVAELQALTPAVSVAALLHRHRRAADLRAQRHRAGLLQGDGPGARLDADRRDQDLSALARGARVGACARRRRSSTRTSGSTARRSPARRSCGRAGSAACNTRTTIWAKRSARLRQGSLRPAGQGRHAEDGPRARSRARDRHPRARRG